MANDTRVTDTASYLEKEGFSTVLAHNGLVAVDKFKEEAPGLVVLDILLPGMDGWQVIQQLRRQKSTPVLFLTARDQVEDRVRGLELGADDYLVKPFAFAELLARIRTLLRRGHGFSFGLFDQRANRAI